MCKPILLKSIARWYVKYNRGILIFFFTEIWNKPFHKVKNKLKKKNSCTFGESWILINMTWGVLKTKGTCFAEMLFFMLWGTLGSLLGMTGHQPSSAEHKLYTTHPMTFISWDFQSWYNSCGTTVNPINKLFSMTTIRIRTISKCLLIPEAFSHSSDLLEGCFGLLLYHSYRWNQHVVLVLKLAMFLPQAVSSLAMSLA